MHAGVYTVTDADAAEGACHFEIHVDPKGFVVQIAGTDGRLVTQDAKVAFINHGTNTPCYCIDVGNGSEFSLQAGQVIRWVAA